MPARLLPSLEPLVDDLEGSGGVVAVVLGGSRARGAADDQSDWDIGVYYRGQLDLGALRRWGEVHAPGSWGRVMNGGAWLTVGGVKVDVLLRDIDVVDAWSERARRGEFEVDALLAYLAGVPTYSLLAERSIARVLRGHLPDAGEFPARLAELAPTRWRFHRRFTIDQARSRAKRGDFVGTVGQAAKAAIEEAHARLCEQRRWTLNEKRIVEAAGLDAVDRLFAGVPSVAASLPDWVDGIAAALEAST